MECVYSKNLVEIYRVTPNLYFRKADLHTRRQCNGAYLVGKDAVAAVDVPSREAAVEMREEAKQLFDKPIRYVFLTHGHEDHVLGLPRIMDQEVTIFSSHRLMNQLIPSEDPYKAAFVGVEGRTRLLMSGLEVELFTLEDTAHSPGDMFVRLPAEGYVCTGDFAVEYQTLYFHEANVEHWIENLRKLSLTPDRFILPGHGEVYPYSHIGEVADFLETLIRAAKRCVAQLPAGNLKDMEQEKLTAIVSDFLSNGTDDAREIREKTGTDAERELRMVFRNLLHNRFR